MDVSDICRRDIVSLGGNATVQHAAQAMRREHVGTVVVTDPEEPGRVMGILTDRALVVDVLADTRPVDGLVIGDLCHSEPVGVQASSSLRNAVETMREAAVRRLFVMQSDGSVIGMLSMDDVIEELALEVGELAGAVRDGVDRERDHTEGHTVDAGPHGFYLRQH